MRTMKISGIALAAFLVAVPASALDMCFPVGPNTVFVAKGYKRPSKGKCRPLTGYEGSGSTPHPATGTACLNAYGTTLYVHWNTVMYLGDYRQFSSRTELPYPSLANGNSFSVTTLNNGVTEVDYDPSESAFPCQPAPLP